MAEDSGLTTHIALDTRNRHTTQTFGSDVEVHFIGDFESLILTGKAGFFYGLHPNEGVIVSIVVLCQCVIQPAKEFGSVSNILPMVGADWARDLLFLITRVPVSISITKSGLQEKNKNLLKFLGEIGTFRNEDPKYPGKTLFLCLGSIKFRNAPGLRLLQW